jgi:D-threo-aldose 1-dehydrogenase
VNADGSVEIATAPVGRTRLRVTRLGFGGAALGGFDRSVEDADADSSLAAAWAGGTRYFDTAPWYGLGVSEHRIGRFLRAKQRQEFVLSTKVGRLITRQRGTAADHSWKSALPFDWHFDYSYDAVMRSFEDSLQRLGLESVDMLLIHDLELGAHGSAAALAEHTHELDLGGGFKALDQLRTEGMIVAIGLGINESQSVSRLVGRFDLDVILLAGRYTLLDQGALAEALGLCTDQGIAVVIGGPFNSGILVRGPGSRATFDYEPAPDEVVERVRRLRDVCARHGVTLPAAALQFPLAHPAVVSVIPGAATAREVEENISSFRQPIPRLLWEELRAEGLIDAAAPVPVGAQHHP